LALAVPLSRFTSQVGDGSACYVRQQRMITSFKTSTLAVRCAVVFTVLALSSFFFPFFWTFILRLYAEGLGLFLVLYFLFAIPATVASIIASMRHEWRHPHGGMRLLSILYGFPVTTILLIVAIALVIKR